MLQLRLQWHEDMKSSHKNVTLCDRFIDLTSLNSKLIHTIHYLEEQEDDFCINQFDERVIEILTEKGLITIHKFKYIKIIQKQKFSKLISFMRTEREFNDELGYLDFKDVEDELDEHIKNLHLYNELRDIGQSLMGKIGQIEGVTTQDLYERYDLDNNE